MMGHPPEAVTLLDLVEAIDGPLAAGIPLKDNFPADAGDRLQAALDRITESTREQLQAIHLSDLMFDVPVDPCVLRLRQPAV